MEVFQHHHPIFSWNYLSRFNFHSLVKSGRSILWTYFYIFTEEIYEVETFIIVEFWCKCIIEVITEVIFQVVSNIWNRYVERRYIIIWVMRFIWGNVFFYMSRYIFMASDLLSRITKPFSRWYKTNFLWNFIITFLFSSFTNPWQ